MPTTEISAETRARILEAAWARVRDQGPSALSVKAIADAAGVSRQLVYFHYGTRAGLIVAMARHRDATGGFPDLPGLLGYVERLKGAAKLRPDSKLVISRNWPDAASRINGAQQLSRGLAKILG